MKPSRRGPDKGRREARERAVGRVREGTNKYRSYRVSFYCRMLSFPFTDGSISFLGFFFILSPFSHFGIPRLYVIPCLMPFSVLNGTSFGVYVVWQPGIPHLAVVSTGFHFGHLPNIGITMMTNKTT
jgi:hypothetical protein